MEFCACQRFFNETLAYGSKYIQAPLLQEQPALKDHLIGEQAQALDLGDWRAATARMPTLGQAVPRAARLHYTLLDYPLLNLCDLTAIKDEAFRCAAPVVVVFSRVHDILACKVAIFRQTVAR